MVTIVCCNLVGKVPKKKLVRPQPDTLPCFPLYLGSKIIPGIKNYTWDHDQFSHLETEITLLGCFAHMVANKRVLSSLPWKQQRLLLLEMHEIQHEDENDGGTYFERWTSLERVRTAMSAWWLVPAPWVYKSSWASPGSSPSWAWSSSSSSQPSSSSSLQQHQQ